MLFGFAIVGYLVLGGLGGGLAVVAGCASLRVPRAALAEPPAPAYRRALGYPFVAAVGALLLGSLLLVADSGRIGALWHLFFAPKASVLSAGAWFIVAAGVLCALLAGRWLGVGALRGAVPTRALSALAVVAGACVALYTGLFLAGMRAVPLWNTPWLPALFVASSLSCGAAVFVGLAHASGVAAAFGAHVRRLVRADVALLAVEAARAAGVAASALAGAGGGDTASAGAASALALLFGGEAWAWWLGFAGLGLVVPLACDVALLRAGGIRRAGRFGGAAGAGAGTAVAVASAGCVLAGAFALRACLVMAGAHPVAAF